MNIEELKLVLDTIRLKTISKASGGDVDEAFMRECRDEMGTGLRGRLLEEERNATQRVIRQMIQERNAQKRAKGEQG
jgi:hypothetical protein